MNKKFTPLFLVALSVVGLSACGGHTHKYDIENPVWSWSQFSAATVTFTCPNCKDTVEGHQAIVSANITLKETVNATCEADGHKIYEASATFEDKVYTDSKTQVLPTTGHNKNESVYHYDETKHWHPCTYCEDQHHFDEANHSLTAWAVVVEPTYHTEGSKERHCSVCAYTENQPIEKLRYTYAEVAALAVKLSKFEENSPYAGDTIYSLIDAIENMNAADKAAHETEVASWLSLANAAKALFEQCYSVVVDINGMDTYEKTSTSKEFEETHGNVLKVNASNDIPGETWSYGTNRNVTMADDIQEVVFSIYAPRPMNVSIIKYPDCDQWYNPVSGEVTNSKTESTLNKGWKEFRISKKALKALETPHIALYLMNAGGAGYGIPALEEAETNGSAYITQIIGIKTGYYEAKGAAVKDKIDAISKRTLDIWAGGQILEAKAEYNKLPEEVKPYVTNYNSLGQIESDYEVYGMAYNYLWQEGQVNKGVSFETKIGYDAKYGLYNEFNNVTWNGFHPHFTPVGSGAVNTVVKMAIYKPQNVGETVRVFSIGNGWESITYHALQYGWNEIELNPNVFTGGKVDGTSIGIEITDTKVTKLDGWRFTPIYLEAK